MGFLRAIKVNLFVKRDNEYTVPYHGCQSAYQEQFLHARYDSGVMMYQELRIYCSFRKNYFVIRELVVFVCSLVEFCQ